MWTLSNRHLLFAQNQIQTLNRYKLWCYVIPQYACILCVHTVYSVCKCMHVYIYMWRDHIYHHWILCSSESLLYFLFSICTTGSGFWVAVLEGHVVGIVAVKPHGTDSLELLRMSVDCHCRKGGVGSNLGRTVLEFAHQFAHTASSTSSFSVILGTTAYTPAAHRLYQSLGFRHVGTTEGYTIPGDDGPIWQWLFYRVRHHHYRLEIKWMCFDWN